MSAAAAEQYGNLAETYNLEVPALLQGLVHQLLPDEARVSLHLFDDENARLPELKAEHKAAVTSVYGFMVDIAHAAEPDLPCVPHPGVRIAAGRSAALSSP